MGSLLSILYNSKQVFVVVFFFSFFFSEVRIILQISKMVKNGPILGYSLSFHAVGLNTRSNIIVLSFSLLKRIFAQKIISLSCYFISDAQALMRVTPFMLWIHQLGSKGSSFFIREITACNLLDWKSCKICHVKMISSVWELW